MNPPTTVYLDTSGALSPSDADALLNTMAGDLKAFVRHGRLSMAAIHPAS